MGNKFKYASCVFFAFMISTITILNAQWVENGIPLCPRSNDQWYSSVTVDGNGGAIITWYEWHDFTYYYDLYAQRIDHDGYLLWGMGGIPISMAIDHQADPEIISDNSGGAVIAWRDQRSGHFDIYAQWIDPDGNIKWPLDGLAICAASGGQYGPHIILDGQGNFIFTWRDDRSGYGKVYCQKVDSAGKAQWTVNGVQICPAPRFQDHPQMVSDGSGGAMVIWDDDRYGVLNTVVLAQRIDGEGNILWSSSGVPVVPRGGRQEKQRLISYCTVGAIITWQDNRVGHFDIYAQLIDTAGVVQWSDEGAAVCMAVGDQLRPRLVSDGAGGAIITWHDLRDGCDDIYAQRIDGNGVCQWTADGVLIHAGPPETGFGWPTPKITSDGSGGAVITWMEGLHSESSWNIFAQRVDREGTVLWAPEGVGICMAEEGQYGTRITTDGAGGAIISWRDMRNIDYGQVYAMRVTADGQTVSTLLQSYYTFRDGSNITVTWTLSETNSDVQFFILRAEMPEDTFTELPSPEIHREGLTFTFYDSDCEPGATYRYRVEILDEDGRTVLFETEPIVMPALPITLCQNYPNPFNPSTSISYYLPARCLVTLDVFDIAGRRVVRLVNEEQLWGYHTVLWEGCGQRGNPVVSGTYLYRLRAGREIRSRKMILLR